MTFPIVRADRDVASVGRGIVFMTVAVSATIFFASWKLLPVWNDTHIPDPITFDGSRAVVAVGQGMDHNRCNVRGFANGVAMTFIVDTGDPVIADFSSTYGDSLGIRGQLKYREMWPGTRYGQSAITRLRQIRVGNVVWSDPEVEVLNNWDYTFGHEGFPILGVGALKMYGINVEFAGNSCRLTIARSRHIVS